MHQVKLQPYLCGRQVPLNLRELHSDNGSEFINHLLVPWCQRQKIVFTRLPVR